MGQIKTMPFHNHMIILGFGSLGRAVLPLIFQQFDIKPSQISIITNDDSGMKIAKEYGLTLEIATITVENYIPLLSHRLKKGDLLVNLSVNISSFDLIKLCQKNEALYIDMSTEPWAGGYIDHEIPLAERTNYALRESVLKLKHHQGSTAVLTHGANPGLVSHFIKQALINIAEDNELNIKTPHSASEWAYLAKQLNIKVIHIAERDTQTTNQPKQPGEFINTWSVDGFMSEGSQPAELGWGTHERHWPQDANHHDNGSRCAIYLNRPGASTRVRTWTPSLGAFHGFLITHAESISLANYLTLTAQKVLYRPTVHYAYSPCPDAILSLLELGGTEWQQQRNKRLIFNEIISGTDELGVLLMGNHKGAYWFGSQLSIEKARQLAPYNNATSLQVVAGVISGMRWAIEHPDRGIVEPEDLDHEYIMNIALPYLGKVAGYYTQWNPLQNRSILFPEHIDREDPWQFLNIRVN